MVWITKNFSKVKSRCHGQYKEHFKNGIVAKKLEHNILINDSKTGVHNNPPR
jgi:hypothetical protein